MCFCDMLKMCEWKITLYYIKIKKIQILKKSFARLPVMFGQKTVLSIQ